MNYYTSMFLYFLTCLQDFNTCYYFLNILFFAACEGCEQGQEGGEAEGEAEIPTGQCVHVTGIEEISDSFLDEVAEAAHLAIETWYMERTHEPAEGEESEQKRFRQVVWKATTSVGILVERFYRRETEPFELFTSEFGQNSGISANFF